MPSSIYGMPAQAPQGWGNWQQGPGQVPSQSPFNQGPKQFTPSGTGAAWNAANPQTMNGTGAPPPGMMQGSNQPQGLIGGDPTASPGMGPIQGMGGGGSPISSGYAPFAPPGTFSGAGAGPGGTFGGAGAFAPGGIMGGGGMQQGPQGGMQNMMNLLMQHPAIQAMLGQGGQQGMPQPGGLAGMPSPGGYNPTMGTPPTNPMMPSQNYTQQMPGTLGGMAGGGPYQRMGMPMQGGAPTTGMPMQPVGGLQR